MNPFKQKLLNIFSLLLEHSQTAKILDREYSLRKAHFNTLKNSHSPYSEFKNININHTQDGDGAIFISSRFRTGSTVLWNIFRNIENCTSYYEPFNERQWFDTKLRGDFVDKTHLGVNDYWVEYEGMGNLKALYEERWIQEELLMDKNSWNPKMKAYIDSLIQLSTGRPVLQFNRVDFRLPWLKQTYPKAKIIHLYRHPRDQWLSFLSEKKLMNKNNVQSTYIDSFYLNSWCHDLEKFFPFLSMEQSPHPYQRFYYLWKLSFLYGQEYSDISISFEDLTQNPKDTLGHVFKALEWDNSGWEKAMSVLKKPRVGKWVDYANDSWFKNFELKCEQTLNDFLNKDFD